MMKWKNIFSVLAVLLLLACQLNAEILIKDGQKVAFLGDSITANGWQQGGYVRLIVGALEKQGIKITPIPAGVGGNKSNDMLARLDNDVLSKSPDWMTLSCGVNDVWHGDKGVDLENYKKNIAAIVDKAAAKGVKVIILTATVIGEDGNKNHEKQVAYNDFLRQFAKERGLSLADLSAMFLDYLKSLTPTTASRYLTVDGVHMNPEGSVLMAKGVLGAMGFSEVQIAQTEQNWLNQPDTAKITVYPYDPRPEVNITLGQYRGLDKIAKDGGVNAVDFGRSLWLWALSEVVQAHANDKMLDAEQIKKETNQKLVANIAELLK
jgi:lysophospholipase L1-like esterase